MPYLMKSTVGNTKINMAWMLELWMPVDCKREAEGHKFRGRIKLLLGKVTFKLCLEG